jgi:urease accessory protein
LRLGTPGAAELKANIESGRALGHLPLVQGVLWRAIGLAEADAVAISGYSTAAGLVAAAVRLGGVGAIEAQGVLATGLGVVAELTAEPVTDDQRIASFVPLIDIAAARHVRAPLRLFAS